MSKKIAWRKEREEEISCDYQNRLNDRNAEVREKIAAIKKRGLAILAKRLEFIREQSLAALKAKLESMQTRGVATLKSKVDRIEKKHEASLNRMRENHDSQIDKLRGSR